MSNIVKRETKEVMSPEDVQVLKDSMFRDFSDAEVKFSMAVANQLALSPLLRQVHFVRRFDKNIGRNVVTPQTGIDGFRLTADRTKKYAGSDEPVFEYEGKHPVKASVTVYKIVGGTRCAFTASARWDEYFPGDKMGFMWKTKPHVMLGKCAEAQALRKAFPAELSSLYADEEMEHTDAVELKSSLIQAKIEKEVGVKESAVEQEPPSQSQPIPETKSEPAKIAPDIEMETVKNVLNPEDDQTYPDDDFEKFDRPGGDYLFPQCATKHKGKKISDLTADDLFKYCSGVKAYFIKENKEIRKEWNDLFIAAQKYLGETF